MPRKKSTIRIKKCIEILTNIKLYFSIIDHIIEPKPKTKGYVFKKAGVFLTDITPKANSQLALFNSENPKSSDLMRTIDNINSKHGKNSVMFGASDHKKMVKMKQARLSKRFTTQWDEMITVKC